MASRKKPRKAKKRPAKIRQTQPDVNQLAKRLVDATIMASETYPHSKP